MNKVKMTALRPSVVEGGASGGFDLGAQRLRTLRKAVKSFYRGRWHSIGLEKFAALFTTQLGQSMSKTQIERWEKCEYPIPAWFIEQLEGVLVAQGFTQSDELRDVLRGLREPSDQADWQKRLNDCRPVYRAKTISDSGEVVPLRAIVVGRGSIRKQLLSYDLADQTGRELDEAGKERWAEALQRLDTPTLRQLNEDYRSASARKAPLTERTPRDAASAANQSREATRVKNPTGVFERPPGSNIWWIHWYDHAGKRHRNKIGTFAQAKRKRGEVKALVHKIKKKLEHPKALVDAGFLPPSAIGQSAALTLREFIRSCIPELKRLKSWKDQERFATRWTKLIGDLKLTDIKATHAEKRRTAKLEQGKSPATCNRETEFLRAILNRAVRAGHLEVNPLSKLSDLPEDNVRVRTLTFNEEARLEAEMTREDFDLVAVALDTGLRRGKVFGMAWIDVDFDHGWITVKGAKAGSSRQVPMSDLVREVLSRRRATQKGPWVFPNRTGKKPMDPDNFCRRVFRPALERAGIIDFRFHDLRHAFASRLAMEGKGGRHLSGLLGHKSTKTTDRYAHLEPDAFRSAIEVLNRLRRDNRGGLRIVK